MEKHRRTKDELLLSDGLFQLIRFAKRPTDEIFIDSSQALCEALENPDSLTDLNETCFLNVLAALKHSSHEYVKRNLI